VPLAYGEDGQPYADHSGGGQRDGQRSVGHGAQRDAQQKQGCDEEQHGMPLVGVSVNACLYNCSLTIESNAPPCFPIPENSC
jgi:hypothetical protein